MKTRGEIFNQLIDMMNELFEIPKTEIKLESRLYEDLKLDSIDAIDLIAQLQLHTGKRLNPEDFKMVRKVSDVVDATEKILSSHSDNEKHTSDT